MKIQAPEIMNQLQELKRKLLSKVYQDVLNKKTITQIHKDLYNISKPYGVLDLVIPCDYIAKRLKKKNADSKEELSLLLIPLLFKSYYSLNKNIVSISNDSREKAIKNALNIAGESGRVFYLCSYHGDSAKDHEPYQGKMYYDDSKFLSYKEKAYIHNHSVKSIQFIMNDPVYLLTRPNCRHWFAVLETEEVLSNSVHNLLLKYNMITAKGKRKPRNIVVAESYTKRLEFHKDLKKIQTNEKLESAIVKDKILINKWKNKE